MMAATIGTYTDRGQPKSRFRNLAGTQLGAVARADLHLQPDNMLAANEERNKWSATVTREPEIHSIALEGLSLQLYNTVEDIFIVIKLFLFILLSG